MIVEVVDKFILCVVLMILSYWFVFNLFGYNFVCIWLLRILVVVLGRVLSLIFFSICRNVLREMLRFVVLC